VNLIYSSVTAMKFEETSDRYTARHVNVRLILMLSLATVVIGAGTAWAEINGGTSVGPQGGTVRSLVVDVQNPQTLYAGTHNAGVFKSIDGGTNWTYSGLAGFTVNNLAIDSQNPGTVYAALYLDNGDTFSSFGVFKSSDGGENWREVNSGLPLDCVVGALASHPQTPGTLFAVTGCGGVFRSTNGGESWQAVNSGLPALGGAVGVGVVNSRGPLATDPQNPSIVYVVAHRCDQSGKTLPGCDSRVFKSTDGGENWREATSTTLSGNLIVSLAIDPQNSSTLYARLFGPGNQNGVSKSTNGGKTWARTSVDLGGGCCTDLLTVDSQGTIYAAGLSGLFKSADGGTTWSAISFFGPVSGVSALVFDPQNPNSMYSAAISGVYKSQDGGASWSSASSEMRAIPVLSVVIDPQNTDTLYAGSYGSYVGVFKSVDRGKNWTANSSGMRSYYTPSIVTLAIDPRNPSNLYAGDEGDGCGGVFRSVDAGMSWTNTGLVNCISAVVVDPQNPSTVYAATLSRGVLKSLDGGESWTEINYGFPGMNVTAMALDLQNAQTLYAGVQSPAGLPGGGSTLLKTTDGGMTWNSTELTVSKSVVSAVTVDSQNSNNVYAVTNTSPYAAGGLWKSVDGGARWRDLSASSPFPIYAIALNPKSPTTIYTGTDFGVMTSADAGETWTPLMSNIGPTHSLTVDPKNPNTLYAAGPSGLFEISISSSLTVTSIAFDATLVKVGAAFNAIIAGSNLSNQTYFDVQVRAPGSATDMVVLNWQTGTSVHHSITAGTVTGTWTISGVRAHQIETDHTGSFIPVSATITVSP
jgi:photosystem II stability/assembly factor-like uncharacterized protein